VARDGREVLSKIDGDGSPHLLILDLEIPYLDEQELWCRLNACRPPLPVVIHTFLPEYPTHLAVPQAAAFLEKKEDTDQLKAVVADVIRKVYPERFKMKRGKQA
jgi:DNA-binding response OmpR family regulator